MSVSTGLCGVDMTFISTAGTLAEAVLVTGDTSNTTNALKAVVVATGDTVVPIGVSNESSDAANQQVSIRISGVVLLTVDGNAGAIDINDSIVSNGAGSGVKATAEDQSAQWAIGFALEPSTAAGEQILVLIDRHRITEGQDD